MFRINNRRYIGSKTKLLQNIKEAAYQVMNDRLFTFADLFGGTGVVAYEFARNGHPTIVNDTLMSNVVAYQAWMGTEQVREDIITDYISRFNDLRYDDILTNYFSDVYGGKYFSMNDAKKIGYIRDYLEEHRPELNYREFCILLTSLLYTTDKIANTVGHFEHYLSKAPIDSNFLLQEIEIQATAKTQIYNEDANELARQIEADVVYLDPPYNARQYVNFYHVLENLARWEKPMEFEGNSMKFKRNHLKSGYSRSIAPKLLEDLVNSLNSQVIIVSYNNTYDARSGASNNKIQEEEIVQILSKRGEVNRIDMDYKAFNSGKTDLKNHKEYLFICKVRR